jgi:hypothetical protein
LAGGENEGSSDGLKILSVFIGGGPGTIEWDSVAYLQVIAFFSALNEFMR